MSARFFCNLFTFNRLIILAYTCISLSTSSTAIAHGGVAFEEDQCVISIGFLKAHFTGYQPNSQGSDEFCEDIPNVEESIFVIDYLHGFLNEMAVDFRIIKDINNVGIYAQWDDIEQIADIESATVFYQTPIVQPNGVFKASYTFKEKGGYIGIITARHHSKETPYNAVFYFQVGGTNYGYLPLFVVFLILAQLMYWLNKRRLKKGESEVTNA